MEPTLFGGDTDRHRRPLKRSWYRPTERITFPAHDGQTLVGRLELPTGRPPRAFALFAHCFTCTKKIKATVTISGSLVRQGIGVLRFDFTGLGESDGDFADTTFPSNVEDLVAAGRHLSQEDKAPSVLIGHSLGGAAVLQAASEMPTVLAVATIRAPSDPGHVVGHLKEWPLEGVVVAMKRAKVHSEDSSRPEDSDARVDAIDQTVKLVSPLTEEQRERLMVIAGRCPVHKTLDAGMRIRTEPDLSIPSGQAGENR